MMQSRYNLNSSTPKAVTDSTFWRYAIAALLVLSAVTVPLRLPVFRDVAFVLAFGAVTMSALWGGLGPAILAAILSGIAVNFLFVAPCYRLSFNPAAEDVLRTLIFFIMSLMVAAFVAGLRRTWEDTKRSESRYRCLADSAPEALIVVDEHAMILYINAEVEKVFDCRAESVLGKQLGQWVPKSIYENALFHLKQQHDSRRHSIPLENSPPVQSGLSELFDLSLATFTRHGADLFALRMRVLPISRNEPLTLEPA